MAKIESAHVAGSVILKPALRVDIALPSEVKILDEIPGVPTEGWNLATTLYANKSLVVSGQDGAPTGIYLTPDESNLYLMGAGTDTLYQYELSVPGNVSTGSHIKTSVSVNAQEASPRDMWLKPDLTKAYVCGDAANTIFQYTLGTPGDISTLSYDGVSKSIVTADGLFRGFYFRQDGLMAYFVGQNVQRVDQWSMSSPWDITTLSKIDDRSVGSETSTPRGVFFKPDGTKMYILDGANQRVYQYTLSTPWTITSRLYDGVLTSLLGEASGVHGMYFNKVGENMYISDLGNDKIFQYTLTD